jgi:hypothetical protein
VVAKVAETEDHDVVGLAAEQLGMSQEDVMRLRTELLMLRGQAEAELNAPLLVYPELNGKPLWEIRVAGSIKRVDGLKIRFDFMLGVDDRRILWGWSRVPDEYQIIAPDGRLLFDGQIVCPDLSIDEDPDSWAGYNVFGSVRSMGVEAMTALLATGRLERLEVRDS